MNLATSFITIYITENLLEKGVAHLYTRPKAKNMILRRMEFSSPIWDARTSVYKITIRTSLTLASEPQYVDLSGTSYTIESPDKSSDEMKSIVQTFVAALLAKDAQAKWFSSRLKESSILKRLDHVWVESDMNPVHEWSIAHWSPIFLEVASQGFTIHWRVSRFEESTPQISSRFLAISRPESPTAESENQRSAQSLDRQVTHEAWKQITIQPSLKMGMPAEEMETVNDIPFTNENTAIDFQQQMRDKDALQEARLRLALAKLKANRLSNTYYQKYGETFTDEEDYENDSEDSE